MTSELWSRAPRLLPYSSTPCRVCGCTLDRACIDPVHGACWWIEDDLCSHCGEPLIVMAEYDALLARAAGVEEIAAWAVKARAALAHDTRADVFEI